MGKTVVLFGAGKSSIYLIEYLIQYLEKRDGKLIVIDRDEKDILKKTKNHPNSEATCIDINNPELRRKTISGADIVISMLPHFLHKIIAKDCLELEKNFCTASYVDEEMNKLHEEAKSKGLVFLNELGVDPGIDHLSAMEMIDSLKEDGCSISEFESFTGGLVAPQCENNPWKYKFTWNPRNLVLASQGGAVKFLHNNRYKYIPYQKVFRRTEIIEIPELGKFEGYANRDSLKYRKTYGLDDIQTMYRGTFRRPGFCRAWDCFVQLGATDDSYIIEDSETMTYRQFINTFLAYHPSDSVELKLKMYLGINQDDVDLWEKLSSLDIFSDKVIGIPKASPAQILEHILKEKWTLLPEDKDMIVMWHKFKYQKEGKQFEKCLYLTVLGENQMKTAMAQTVGLPLAIGVKLILEEKISNKGVVIPVHKEIYEPILTELKEWGIEFKSYS